MVGRMARPTAPAVRRAALRPPARPVTSRCTTRQRRRIRVRRAGRLLEKRHWHSGRASVVPIRSLVAPPTDRRAPRTDQGKKSLMSVACALRRSGRRPLWWARRPLSLAWPIPGAGQARAIPVYAAWPSDRGQHPGRRSPPRRQRAAGCYLLRDAALRGGAPWPRPRLGRSPAGGGSAGRLTSTNAQRADFLEHGATAYGPWNGSPAAQRWRVWCGTSCSMPISMIHITIQTRPPATARLSKAVAVFIGPAVMWLAPGQPGPEGRLRARRRRGGGR